MIKQAKALKNYTRNQRFNRPNVPASAALLPRETFADHPDVLDAYDTMVRLNEAITENARAAGRKSQEADQAALTYKREVADALAAGMDPANVKNLEPQLRAESKAHEQFATDAKQKATAHGYVLGDLMHQVAAACFPNR
jgi:hypothetical protein